MKRKLQDFQEECWTKKRIDTKNVPGSVKLAQDFLHSWAVVVDVVPMLDVLVNKVGDIAGLSPELEKAKPCIAEL